MARRWALLAIGSSVALNIFLVGFLLAQLWSSHAQSAPEGLAPREILRQLTGQLPIADAEHLRRALANRAPELLRIRREAHAASEEVRVDIGAVRFDAETLRADFAATRIAREKLRPLIEQAQLEALPQMSEEAVRSSVTPGWRDRATSREAHPTAREAFDLGWLHPQNGGGTARNDACPPLFLNRSPGR